MTQYGTSSTRLAWRFSLASRWAGGFTAIELMVTVAIMAVLMALAAPSFTPLIEGWRVRQAAEQLQSTLYYARSEAIKRGGRVVVQKLPNNTNGCTTASANTAWGCGWFVCEDQNRDGDCDTTDPVLQRYDAPSQMRINRRSTDNVAASSIVLNRWGLTEGTLPSFELIPYSNNTASSRGLCMSSGGRIRFTASGTTTC
jgi:type IV fimbrial biogenesis protein FimT